MRQVTSQLIHDFQILTLGYDFMGYPPQTPPSSPQPDLLTYHHLLVPRRIDPSYTYENGVILYSTPHAYLHIIERFSRLHFEELTKEMHEMKKQLSLNPYNLHNIDEILTDFESRYSTTRTSKNKTLIRTPYLNRQHITPPTSTPSSSPWLPLLFMLYLYSQNNFFSTAGWWNGNTRGFEPPI